MAIRVDYGRARSSARSAEDSFVVNVRAYGLLEK